MSRALLALVFIALTAPGAADAEQPVSASEQKLLLENHLANTQEASALHYTYRRGGSQEPAFDDRVVLSMKARKGDGGRDSEVQFLSGERTLAIPPVEQAKGNPVILSFLERDVREMQRLTKGQPNYFRKRLRMALAENAKLEQTEIQVGQRSVPAWRITLTPYVNDPLKPRFGRLAEKTYQFTLSDKIPGWVFELRSTVLREDQQPLIEEVLSFEAAQGEKE